MEYAAYINLLTRRNKHLANGESEEKDKMDFIIQVNIPFCYHECSYCAQHNARYDEGVIASYVEAMLREIEAAAPDMDGDRVRAVSIEGGSPALASPAGLQKIIRSLRKHFHFSEDVQISLQTMPGEYSRALMEKMRDAGVNHWIIGLQTADWAEHDLLSRPYRYDTITMADMAIRTFHPRDLSFDLLYGIPGQTWHTFRMSLEKVLSYAPDHLTLYPLQIHSWTWLGEQAAESGTTCTPMDEEAKQELYASAAELLASNGLHAYTSWDFCREGHENRFRLNQLNLVPQLGIGYRARTYLDDVMYVNGHSLKEYMTSPDRPDVLAAQAVRVDDAARRKMLEENRTHIVNR